MLSPSAMREQEFAPLLFSLTPADAMTPRSATPHRTQAESSMSTQRRSMVLTPGSVHTEATPQAVPPPMLRLTDDVNMDEPVTAGRQAAPSSLAPLQPQQPVYSLQYEPAPQYEDVWVTIFGFTPTDVPLILREFSSCGDILQWGTYGQPQANYIHVQFQNKFGAQRALLRNGESLLSSLIVGVKPLDVKHRAAVEGVDAAQGSTLQVVRPPAVLDRPYRLESGAGMQQVPQPSRSLLSKVAEYVLGVS
ncbi:hypothetical protein V8C86DRAFT_2466287 [Haematococcus lacustris]